MQIQRHRQITPAPLDDLPPSPIHHAGTTSYIDNIVAYVRRAPDSSVLYAAGSIPSPSALATRAIVWECGRKPWKVAPSTAWGGLDPDDVADQLLPLLSEMQDIPRDDVRWPSSFGAASRQILQAYIQGKAKDIWPCLKPDQIPPIRRAIRGGIQRTQTTFCPDAWYLDLRRAYLSVLQGWLPSGYAMPLGKTWRGGPTTAECLESLKRMHARRYGGIIVCQLHSPAGLLLLDPTYQRSGLHWTQVSYPDWPVVWVGPSNELEAILEGGIAEIYQGQVGGIDGQIVGLQGRAFPLTQRLKPLMEHLESRLSDDLWKLIYKSMWPAFDASSSWTGFIGDLPPDIETDQRGPAEWADGVGDREIVSQYKRDRLVKRLWWRYEPAPIDGAGQVFRPDVVAWVTGAIRARLYSVWKRWNPCMALVDAVVVPWETREHWMPEIASSLEGAPTPTGGWKAEASGVYLGASPGQYMVGGRKVADHPEWRFRLCGVPERGQGVPSLVKCVKALARAHGLHECKWLRITLSKDAIDHEFAWPVFEPKPGHQNIGGRE